MLTPRAKNFLSDSVSSAAHWGLNPAFLPSHTGEFNIGTLVASLPGASRYEIGARTGWPGVS